MFSGDLGVIYFYYMEEKPYPMPIDLSATVTPLLGGYFFDELIKHIEESKFSIKAVQYQWKWNIHDRHSHISRLGNTILRAQKRGVAIQVILNQESRNRPLTKINQVTGDQLARQGVQVRNRNPAGLLHTKLWIIDGKYCFVGSHNISTRSLTMNEEFSVKVESTVLASFLNNYFALLWGV